MIQKKKLLSALLILFITCTALYGCGESNPGKLRVGYVPIAVGLPLFVAADEGFFKEQGFEVEMIQFASSNEVGNAATSGQIDVLSTASNVVFDIGFVSKKKPKLIITNPYTDQKGFVTDYLLVKDTSSIKTIEQLRGKKIGVFPGSVIKIFCNLVFEKYGLTTDEYELIELQPRDWATTLQAGKIDALSALEPQASQIMKDGVGFPIVSGLYAQLMPRVPLSGNWISEDFFKNHDKKISMKIVAAVDKAVEFILNNPDKAKHYLIKYANVRDDILERVQLNPWQKHSEINKAEIQNFINTLFDRGAILNQENINDYLIEQ